MKIKCPGKIALAPKKRKKKTMKTATFVLFIPIATADVESKVKYGNSTGLQFVEEAIDLGWNVCLFDFTGSGLSEGDHISLGHY